jgi:hypothetical protein
MFLRALKNFLKRKFHAADESDVSGNFLSAGRDIIRSPPAGNFSKKIFRFEKAADILG